MLLTPNKPPPSLDKTTRQVVVPRRRPVPGGHRLRPLTKLSIQNGSVPERQPVALPVHWLLRRSSSSLHVRASLESVDGRRSAPETRPAERRSQLDFLLVSVAASARGPMKASSETSSRQLGHGSTTQCRVLDKAGPSGPRGSLHGRCASVAGTWTAPGLQRWMTGCSTAHARALLGAQLRLGRWRDDAAAGSGETWPNEHPVSEAAAARTRTRKNA